jgi:hypothetical protein
MSLTSVCLCSSPIAGTSYITYVLSWRQVSAPEPRNQAINKNHKMEALHVTGRRTPSLHRRMHYKCINTIKSSFFPMRPKEMLKLWLYSKCYLSVTYGREKPHPEKHKDVRNYYNSEYICDATWFRFGTPENVKHFNFTVTINTVRHTTVHTYIYICTLRHLL